MVARDPVPESAQTMRSDPIENDTARQHDPDRTPRPSRLLSIGSRGVVGVEPLQLPSPCFPGERDAGARPNNDTFAGNGIGWPVMGATTISHALARTALCMTTEDTESGASILPDTGRFLEPCFSNIPVVSGITTGEDIEKDTFELLRQEVGAFDGTFASSYSHGATNPHGSPNPVDKPQISGLGGTKVQQLVVGDSPQDVLMEDQ